jgi:hypothetical protein
MAKPTSSVKWAFSHMHRKKRVEGAPGQGEKAAAAGGKGGGSGQQQWRRWGAKRAVLANGEDEGEEKVEMELRPFLVECKFDGAPNLGKWGAMQVAGLPARPLASLCSV